LKFTTRLYNKYEYKNDCNILIRNVYFMEQSSAYTVWFFYITSRAIICQDFERILCPRCFSVIKSFAEYLQATFEIIRHFFYVISTSFSGNDRSLLQSGVYIWRWLGQLPKIGWTYVITRLRDGTFSTTFSPSGKFEGLQLVSSDF